MPHNIVSDLCEGVSNCVNACPVGCIKPGIGKNDKGKNFFWINPEICIDCGICYQVCPIKGAVIQEERKGAQKTP